MAKLITLRIGDSGNPIGIEIVRPTQLSKHLQKLLHRNERCSNLPLATQEVHTRISLLIKKMNHVNGWKVHVEELVFLRDQVLPEIASPVSKLDGAWNASHLEEIKGRLAELEKLASRRYAPKLNVGKPGSSMKRYPGTAIITVPATQNEVADRVKQDSLRIAWGEGFPVEEIALIKDGRKRVMVEGITKD